jgi:hypothetical protein
MNKKDPCRQLMVFLASCAAMLASAAPTLTPSTVTTWFAPRGQTTSIALQAAVMDAGHYVAGAHVLFTIGGCGTFGGAASAELVTPAIGYVSAPPFTASDTVGSCKVTATYVGTSQSATFTVNVYDPAAATLSGSYGDEMFLRTGHSSDTFTLTLTDAAGRIIPHTHIQATSSDRSCAFFSGPDQFFTDDHGKATFNVDGGTSAARCTVTLTFAGRDVRVPLTVYPLNELRADFIPAAPLRTHVNESFPMAATLTLPDGRAFPGAHLFYTVSDGGVGTASASFPALSTGQSSVFRPTDAGGRMSTTIFPNGVAGTYTLIAHLYERSWELPVTQLPKELAPGPDASQANGKYQDMWWGGPDQNGWGVSIVHHGDTLFVVIYGYSAGPRWVVMPGGTWDATHSTYSGDAYKPTMIVASPGPAFDSSRFVLGGVYSRVSITFKDDDHAVLHIANNGSQPERSWDITRQEFGPPAAPAPQQYGDMWWAGPSQSGWGITVIQQQQSLFIVWFWYDDYGQPKWYVVPAGSWTAPGLWEGTYYDTYGDDTLMTSGAYSPARLRVNPIGKIRMQFSADGRAATFESGVTGGPRQTFSLVRQAF